MLGSRGTAVSIALAGVFVASLLVRTAPVAQAADRSRCSSLGVDIDYRIEKMTIRYKFRRLAHCFKGTDVKRVRVSGTLLREAVVAQGEDRARDTCALAERVCGIVLSLEHPDVEHAEYTSRVTLESIAGKEVQEETSQAHVTRCTSLVRMTLCDP